MEIVMENVALRVVISTAGGHIEEIADKRRGGSHYWPYDPAVWSRRTSVCFPICGGIPGQTYTYEGITYQMPMHGFLRDQLFEVTLQTPQEVWLEHRYTPETLVMYPFFYSFQIRYRLGEGGLHVTYRVENLSAYESMLFGVGSHYTYRVPVLEEESEQDVRLRFSLESSFTQLFLKDGMLSGQTAPFDHKKGISLDGLDSSSLLLQCHHRPEGHEVSLGNLKTGSRTAVAFRGFDYCVLWRPFAGAPFVCIEPWSSTPERVGSTGALENKHAMTALAPQSTQEFFIDISVG